MTKMNANGSAGAVYGFGFVGALVYYLQHAGTVMLVLIGILKAIVWPALLIYSLFGFLKM